MKIRIISRDCSIAELGLGIDVQRGPGGQAYAEVGDDALSILVLASKGRCEAIAPREESWDRHTRREPDDHWTLFFQTDYD